MATTSTESSAFSESEGTQTKMSNRASPSWLTACIRPPITSASCQGLTALWSCRYKKWSNIAAKLRTDTEQHRSSWVRDGHREWSSSGVACADLGCFKWTPDFKISWAPYRARVLFAFVLFFWRYFVRCYKLWRAGLRIPSWRPFCSRINSPNLTGDRWSTVLPASSYWRSFRCAGASLYYIELHRLMYSVLFVELVPGRCYVCFLFARFWKWAILKSFHFRAYFDNLFIQLQGHRSSWPVRLRCKLEGFGPTLPVPCLCDGACDGVETTKETYIIW